MLIWRMLIRWNRITKPATEKSPRRDARFDGRIFAAVRTTRIGIGEWMAQYIAMRVLRGPDAFPAAEIGLLRALMRAEEGRPSPLRWSRGPRLGGRGEHPHQP